MIKEIIDKDLNIKDIKQNKTILENDCNKNNDISTTKEEESFITDEVIQYCSSPKRGLVSINISKNVNEKLSPVPTEKNMIPSITNTVTMNIALIKKEIDIKDIDKIKKRRCTFNKDEENEKENHFKNKEHFDKLIKENNKDNKCKSNFKDKKEEFIFTEINRRKLDSLNIEINKTPIKKKTSKKKKKNKKSNEIIDENKNKERDEKKKFSFEEENDNKKKKKKKKKNKKEISKKKIKKETDEGNKGDDIENDKGHSPNIIILDFTSSENNNDDSDDSDKNKNSENNDIDEKDNLNKNKRKLLTNINKPEDENDFFKKRQKTIIIKNTDELKKRLLLEKKIITPKTKQSCCINSPYKICQTKMNLNPGSRKISSKNLEYANRTKIKAKSKSICPITQKKSGNKDLNKEKDSHKLLKIFSKKINNKNPVEDRPIKLRHSISKNFTNRQSPEKLKSKIKEKESIQSCKALNNHNEINPTNNIENEKNKKIKEEIINQKSKSKEKTKLIINYQNKSNKNLEIKNLNKTPQSKLGHKSSYNSNRNLTKITINPKTAEQKDIHLVFEGKKETIINYTNQEMVDDENEYMVECLKVLLKLKMEEQPRCKQKVNFNFPLEEKKKKIALFDLDETLVHCTKDKKGLNGDIVNIKLPTNKTVPVGLNIRSHWKEALDLIKNHYHIVVYTASHQSYADAVLNYIDKENKYFQYRLYRNHCVQCDVDGIKFYVKDLDTLNKYYNLKDVVLIDNSVLSFAYHLNNGIPIVPFIEQKDDTQLLMLAYYLVSIANYDDLTQENKKHINIEYYLLMAKKLSEEESEEEDDEVNEEEKNDIMEENNEISNKDINKENENKNNETININDLSREKSKVESEGSLDRSKVENNKKFLHFKKSNKILLKRSEKALKIAEDMKKNIGEVYKSKNNIN